MKSRTAYLSAIALLILFMAALTASWLAVSLPILDPEEMISAFLRIAAALTIVTTFLLLLPVYAERRTRMREREILAGISAGRDIPPSSLDDLSPALNKMIRDLRAARSEIEGLKKGEGQNRRLASIGGIVSGIVHEIRTPLTNIIGFSQLALEESGERKIGQDIQKIIESAKRCERITESLLAFSRARTPVHEQVRLFDLVALSTESLTKPGVSCNFPENASGVMGDSNLLSLVFRNLISNSREAGANTVAFSSRREGQFLRITCQDDGTGIPAAVSGSLFDAFKSTKKNGLGLGMALSRDIIESHGGRIVGRNRPEGGAEIEIHLPVRPDAVGLNS